MFNKLAICIHRAVLKIFFAIPGLTNVSIPGDCGVGTRTQSEHSWENHLYKLWPKNIGIQIFIHSYVTKMLMMSEIISRLYPIIWLRAQENQIVSFESWKSTYKLQAWHHLQYFCPPAHSPPRKVISLWGQRNLWHLNENLSWNFKD